MRVESVRRGLFAKPGLRVTTALSILLLFSLAAAAAPVAEKALECNSALNIDVPPMNFLPGDTLTVTLTVQSGASNDAFDNPVPQSFQTISFFPSCATTLACAVDAPLRMTFVGPVTNVDCPVASITATPMAGGGEIELGFTGGTGPDPNALTLPAAASGGGTVSCQMTFPVQIAAAVELGSVIDNEATTAGVCDPGGLMLNSSAEATGMVNLAPPVCEVIVDKQVDCGSGFIDVGDVAESCTAPMSGDPVTIRWLASAGAMNNVDLVNCQLTDSNLVALGAPFAVGAPIPPGTIDLELTRTTPTACSELFAGGEPDTATLTCDCAGTTPTLTVMDEDTAEFMCPVPTVGEIGLIALALLLALGSWVALRRRRVVA